MKQPIPVKRCRSSELQGISEGPVILTDVVGTWNAGKNWSLAFFRDRYGADLVLPSVSPLHHRAKKVTLRAFLDYLDAPDRGLAGAWVHPFQGSEVTAPPVEEPSGRFYLMNWYGFQRHPELGSDIAPWRFLADWTAGAGLPLARMMERVHQIEYWSVYFGPAGTFTPLHRDFNHSIGSLAQIAGRKKVTLYSPQDHARAAPHECEIGPGDLLLIPPDWWHEVLGLEKSITVSHNFYNRTNAYLHLRESMRGIRGRISDSWAPRDNRTGISVSHPAPPA